MNQVNIGTLVLFAASLSCAYNPRNLEERPVPASAACAQSTAAIQEAVFRYMFDHNESAWQKDVSYYFLTLANNEDPPPDFMLRFKRHVPSVKPASESYLTTKGQPRHSHSELRALYFSITNVECATPENAEVRGGYSEGNLSAANHVFKVVRTGDHWVVTNDKLLWIS